MTRNKRASLLADRIAAVLAEEQRPLPAKHVARLLSDARRVQTLVVEQTLSAHRDVFVPTGGNWALREWGELPDRLYSRMRDITTAPAVTGGADDEPTGIAARTEGEQVVSVTDWLGVVPRLYKWQVEALLEWEKAGRRGIVEAVTGAGKTAVGAAAIRAHLDNGGRAVVLVPTIELMNQWRDSLKTWIGIQPESIGRMGGGHDDPLSANRVTICVVATGAKRLPVAIRELILPVLLVADECHRYGAKTFQPAVTAPYSATLGLSATPARGDGAMEHQVMPAIGNRVYKLDYVRALQDGVISPFEIIFVGLPFSSRERAAYDRYSEEIDERRDKLLARYPELRDVPDLFEQLEELYEATGDTLIRALQGSVSRRRQVLFAAEARHNFVRDMFTGSLAFSRVILFHELIEECERLANMLNQLGVPAAAHHSKLTKTERREVLQRFRYGRVTALAAPRTLDEGIDVPDADLGIIVAGSKQMRQRIQRVGRVLRKAPGKDVARVFVLYVEDTAEDPKASRDGDGFIAAIEDVGRAQWTRWPQRGREIRNLLGNLGRTND
jgi:RNA polymerase primary sigma factor